MSATPAQSDPRLERWAARLANLTVSPLSRDYPEQDGSRRAIEAFESLRLTQDGQRACTALSASSGSPSAFVTLLTAYVVLISRLTGDEDIAVGTSTAEDGRPFVLRAAVSHEPSFQDLQQSIAKVREQVLRSIWGFRLVYAEGCADIVPLLALRSHIRHATKSEKEPILFRFAAFEAPAASQDYPANTFDTADLVLNIATTGQNAYEFGAYYNQRLFASKRIAGILLQLQQLIINAAQDPTAPTGKIDFTPPEQKALLPDPTADLDWSGYRGAIHDIFAQNARRHPERICIVETESSSSPRREFTYQQIHEASNVVGHHLVQAGINRGDVVVIYAHRGVDLVVAVMGTLKAGATFSVIDPAYPPQRQNIYLDVARPRALIVIKKATEEAGPMSDEVKDFISSNLTIAATIPALELQDDGLLLGGAADGNVDVLSAQHHLQAKEVGVVVGPDSIPTLSFTSGSEGRPKGVRGRHFSLAYYFPWMAKTFKLGEDDKFTMLSGIAHDPIQRDIFTPLFLGAQLLVPSREDIQNERLADWMRRWGATVTHLTPAMGQILVGGATAQFPTLHHAFFVGDILIKRDCRSLRSLAPNVNIVNMYGTTETQRSVSYYEIPSYTTQPNYLESMKDVIPAGRGMLNVQLLVVNRHDRTRLCAVGEVGEIYVRAGGLAEGYLNNDELNQQKFLTNWFISPQQWDSRDTAASGDEPWRAFYKGPRDRLYRSGDLGRYTPTGEVECSGRADDQVKIRGFRIELGEIDTHLSQHALVRENVTLVRRDKYEEPTLVSYIVPHMDKWKDWLGQRGIEEEESGDGMVGMLRRFRPLREDLRAYLRGKLPVYAVPAVIVPLKRMPLNPNGKIDKPALPFPDTEELSAAAPARRASTVRSASKTEQTLAEIWSRLIPNVTTAMIGPDDSFFDLGGHSITAQQMIFQIRKTWSDINLSMSAIFRSPTLRAFAAEIDRLQEAQSFTLDSDTAAASGQTPSQAAEDYAADAEALAAELPVSFPNAEDTSATGPVTVFLTGATGFLGAYIVRDLLSRSDENIRIVALVRAKSDEQAVNRVKATCQAYGTWSDAWASRIECVRGDLGDERLGLTPERWSDISNRVDIVIHNGALVHWVYPYSNLRTANVLGTVDTLKMCASGKPKRYVLVSSTSVLDTEYYVSESERIIGAGGHGIDEADDLQGSRTGLGTGYGQSKWAAEYLTREAGRRGLRGTVVRPGYVTGESTTGITNTDDFLARLIKGCIQLSSRPNINNSVNMVPVDHVARIVVASAFHPPQTPLGVAHVTGHPRLRFNEFLGALETYGFAVPMVDYVPWASGLESYVHNSLDSDAASQNALMPLYHFVTADLPANTRAPELDDSNAAAALRADASDQPCAAGVTEDIMGIYLRYLVSIGFLPAPQAKGARELPSLSLSDAQRDALKQVGGRGGF
ncbi:large subunit of alpha-aminoadipate reductase [Ascosphaera acerosa]|nr:large subunit of alpha-aminoadipate reductase [Ascosphaera acerosa]